MDAADRAISAVDRDINLRILKITQLKESELKLGRQLDVAAEPHSYRKISEMHRKCLAIIDTLTTENRDAYSYRKTQVDLKYDVTL